MPAPSLDTGTAPWSPESATATLTSEPETAPTSPEIGRGGAVLAERGPWWAGEPKKKQRMEQEQEQEQGVEAGPSECAPSHEQGQEGEHEQEGGEGAGVEKKKKKHRRHKSKKKCGRGASEGGVGETMGNAGA
ncbi:hypothetical protein JCM5296_003634 [Sporobolomyces johnsonii]